jgi:succinyl-CoA synthetase alpha subunit
MAILIGNDTRLVIQGITGRDGSFHGGLMKEYGTKVVAGVTPGKGGQDVDGIPVFNTVEEAVDKEGANASILFVPAAFGSDAILEASDAGVDLIVAVTEGIPVRDMMKVLPALKRKGTRLIGPNSPGLISPGKAKVGILPGKVFKEGPVGVISRSGTLTYEIAAALSDRGIGQSTVIGVGGDPIIGSNYIDLMALFDQDPETKAVVLIGEIGGTDEQDAAKYVEEHFQKPVAAFIAGRTAPAEKRMGHAGAIISGSAGTAEEKTKAFNEVGIKVAEEPAQIADLIQELI